MFSSLESLHISIPCGHSQRHVTICQFTCRCLHLILAELGQDHVQSLTRAPADILDSAGRPFQLHFLSRSFMLDHTLCGSR